MLFLVTLIVFVAITDEIGLEKERGFDIEIFKAVFSIQSSAMTTFYGKLKFIMHGK